MSRRLNKKRMKAAASKNINIASPAAPSEAVSASAPTTVPNPVTSEVPATAPTAKSEETFELYIQYHGSEYDADEIADKIYEKCSVEGMNSSELKIYIKPEDKKAYFACAGGNSFIEL